MKIMVLFLLLCIVPMVAFSGVDAEIIGKEIDTRGNIVIKVNFKVDGVEVVSKYPKLDGKYYYVLRYSYSSFYGMTNLQIKNAILKDIEQQINGHIIRKFGKINNVKIESDMSVLIGAKISKDSAIIRVDTDKDGIIDTEYEVKTDGTKTETIITP